MLNRTIRLILNSTSQNLVEELTLKHRGYRYSTDYRWLSVGKVVWTRIELLRREWSSEERGLVVGSDIIINIISAVVPKANR